MSDTDTHALVPVDRGLRALPQYGAAPGIAQAAFHADRAAGGSRFARYLDELTPATIRAQHSDLVQFGTFLLAVGVVPTHLPRRAARRDILERARLGAARVQRITQLPADAERDYLLHTWAAQFATEPTAWQSVTFGVVEGFLQWMLRQGYALASINRALATVRAYTELVQAADQTIISAEDYARIRTVHSYSARKARNVDAKRAVQRIGAKKATPVIISVAQARALKHQPLDTPQGTRDAVLLCLLLDLGLRVSEVVGLQLQNLIMDGTTHTLTVYRQKTDAHSLLLLGDDLRIALEHYLLVRDPTGALGATDQPLLVPSRKNAQLVLARGLTTNGVYKRVHTLGTRVGLANLGPHDGRHHWTTMAIEGGTDINAVMQAGGWNSPAMVLRYADTQHIANKNVVLKSARAFVA